MEKYNSKMLDQHYIDNILLANKEKILSGGKGDSFLINASEDDRMALVLLIRIPQDITGHIEKCINEIKKIEPSLYYYSCSDFHITVIDILRGKTGRTIPKNIDEYKACINECAKEISPFHIMFEGLTVSDNAIMVRGYYEDELQKFRQLLRENFRKKGLHFEERYETISAHITIARAYTGFNNPQALIEYTKKEHAFGKMKVDSMELSFHNWYDTRKDTLDTINL